MGLITACLICTVSTPALGDFIFLEGGLGATVSIHENKFEVGTETFTVHGNFWDLALSIIKSVVTVQSDLGHSLLVDNVTGIGTIQHILVPPSEQLPGENIPGPILPIHFGTASQSPQHLLAFELPGGGFTDYGLGEAAHGPKRHDVTELLYVAIVSKDGLHYNIDNWHVDLIAEHIPEPSTLLLLASGLVGLMLWRRRQHIVNMQ
jgi:hypothetical protein